MINRTKHIISFQCTFVVCVFVPVKYRHRADSNGITHLLTWKKYGRILQKRNQIKKKFLWRYFSVPWYACVISFFFVESFRVLPLLFIIALEQLPRGRCRFVQAAVLLQTTFLPHNAFNSQSNETSLSGRVTPTECNIWRRSSSKQEKYKR